MTAKAMVPGEILERDSLHFPEEGHLVLENCIVVGDKKFEMTGRLLNSHQRKRTLQIYHTPE